MATKRKASQPLEEEVPLTFLDTKLQDTKRTPLGAAPIDVDGTVRAPRRYAGVYSVLQIATGKDANAAKSLWDNAKKKPGPSVQLRFIEGWQKPTPSVDPEDVPALLAGKLPRAEAQRVLTDRSMNLLDAMSRAGVDWNLAKQALQKALDSLEQGTEAELRGLKALAGLFGCADTRTVRFKRVPSKQDRDFLVLVFAAIDLVMLAKKCSYAAAQSICYRIFKEYFNIDLEENSVVNQASCLIYHAVHFDGQATHGRGRPVLCLEIEQAVEFLLLIPGSELSANLRRKAAQTLIGVEGGDRSLVGRILVNRRFQDFLKATDPDHPLRALGERAEHSSGGAAVERYRRLRVSMRVQNHGIHRSLARMEQHYISRMEGMEDRHAAELAGVKAELKNDIREHSEQLSLRVVFAMQRGLARAVAAGFSSVLPGFRLSVGQHLVAALQQTVMNPAGALVQAFRKATKQPAVRQTSTEKYFPADQKATGEEQACRLLSLLAVAKKLYPEMHYGTWKRVRGLFGKRAKAERLRRHRLAPSRGDYVEKPLLWSFTGNGTGEGGGPRYVFLLSEEPLLAGVWTAMGINSADQTARRFQAVAEQEPGYVAEAWPLLAAELEPLGHLE